MCVNVLVCFVVCAMHLILNCDAVDVYEMHLILNCDAVVVALVAYKAELGYVQIVQMSRSEHAVVDDAGEDDGTEKKKKKKGAQDEASEYALVAADAGEDDGTEKRKKKRKGA
ncbi:hypothetical protein Tco_1409049 [Tanacetum coccineum]